MINISSVDFYHRFGLGWSMRPTNLSSHHTTLFVSLSLSLSLVASRKCLMASRLGMVSLANNHMLQSDTNRSVAGCLEDNDRKQDTDCRQRNTNMIYHRSDKGRAKSVPDFKTKLCIDRCIKTVCFSWFWFWFCLLLFRIYLIEYIEKRAIK